MILEAQKWRDNSELISAMFDMHVWPKRWAEAPKQVNVLDVTYHLGKWWLDPLPDRLRLEANILALDGFDYRDIKRPDNTYDVVAFDPDYVAPGGRESSTITDFNNRYGLKDIYESPATLQEAINSGVKECARVVKPQGLLMMKCTNYISSGKLWLGEYHTIQAGLAAGLVVEDIVVHIGGTGPQPKREKRQKHVRSNSSRLIVFRKPGRRPKGN